MQEQNEGGTKHLRLAHGEAPKEGSRQSPSWHLEL